VCERERERKRERKRFWKVLVEIIFLEDGVIIVE
jgi:hypothetical protein